MSSDLRLDDLSQEEARRDARRASVSGGLAN